MDDERMYDGAADGWSEIGVTLAELREWGGCIGSSDLPYILT